jgi:tetratricopeptide (TPR) repeat protein
VAVIEAELRALRSASLQNDQEIDALQVGAAARDRAWYRSPEGLVPVLSLLFALLTAGISGGWAMSQHDAAEQRLRQQQSHDTETELRAVLQRLNALPKENALLYEQLSDPAVSSSLGSFVNTENTMLLDQSVELIEQIPDRVSATEYVTVAWFMQSWVGDYEEAERLYQRATERAIASGDAFGYLSTARGYAQLLFSIGRIDDGRARYRDALGVHERFQDDRPTVASYAHWLDGATELQWSQAELGQGNCAEAREHLEESRESFGRIGQSGSGSYQPQIEATQQAIAACEPA